MPTITTADAIMTATKDLQETLKGDTPQSQYDKGMVDKFTEILNAKAKTYQIDKILERRAQKEAAQSQRVSADTNEDEDICLDEEDLPDTSPEQDTPAANKHSRVGSGQRTVTQEVLMTVLDISVTGYLLTPNSTASRKFHKQFFSEMAAAILDGDTGKLLEYRHLMKNPKALLPES